MRLLCKTFKLSRAAYYQAKRGASEKIVPIDRKRKERASSVGTEDLKARIRELVDKYPAWGVRKIWTMLKRDGLRVGQRRVWALMKAMGLTLAHDRERGQEPRRGQVATPEQQRVPEPTTRQDPDRKVARGVQHGSAAQLPGVSDPGRVRPRELECGVRTKF